MTADVPGPDPKSLWQDQEQETDPVTLDQIHAMLRQWNRKTRRAAIGSVIILILVAFVGGLMWMRARDLTGFVLAAVFVLGEAASLLLGWRMLHVGRDPAEPAGAYLHRRLLRRLRYLNGGWMIALAPLLPPVVLAQYFVLTHGHGPWWRDLAPSLFAVVALIYVQKRVRRGLTRIKAQLDDLDGLMAR